MSRAHPLPDQDWDAFVSQHARRNSPRAHAKTWVLGLMTVAAFFVVIHLAERDADELQTVATIAADLKAAESRMQRAAQALCVAELGPGTVALWTREGDLVCRPAEVVVGVAK